MSFWDRKTDAQMRNIPTYWHEMTEVAQIDQLVEASREQPIAILKHSTRCGISHSVKHFLESEWDFEPNEVELYYLDLIAHRDVSNAIADSLGVIHQSPQLILLKSGKVAFHTSHHAISARALREQL